MFIMVFSSAEDELTKQRATDVTDIKNGVLSILLGREERDISLAPPNHCVNRSRAHSLYDGGHCQKEHRRNRN